MIPMAAITEWSNSVSWTDLHQVEQDLMISRVLCAIFQDDFLKTKLAFRGGTALHKLYLHPQKRYSEDIDLVQVDSEPIGDVLDRLREVLNFLGLPKTKQKMSNNVLLYQYSAESLPATKMRLKIEINCKEHLSVFEKVEVPFGVENKWYSGSSALLTYCFDELIGTKIRALYQRKKGRDLFDLYFAICSGKLNAADAVQCFKTYMHFSNTAIPTARMFELNLMEKLSDSQFRKDIVPILNPDVHYDIDKAFETVNENIIAII
ncbi:hypothetical protein AGMMS49983_14000 [Clostridia bacterium]|nr:hypothetical protein AGMMS49983_14000 [Clostridia bacterium]